MEELDKWNHYNHYYYCNNNIDMSKSKKLIAENEYKKQLKRMIKLLGNDTTYLTDLYKVGKKLFGTKFIGVFPSDEIPNKIKKNHMAIVNLDTSNQGGSHWVSICKDNSNTIWVYDSFARKTYSILRSIYGKGRKIKDTEHDIEQKDNESNCGSRSMAFLCVFHKLGSSYAKWI
jgi:hypothetical protein